MILSLEQDVAIKKVDHWYKNESRTKQVFKLFGPAGTGKSTLAKHFAANTGGIVKFATFTGKAAHVMRKKGCAGATTIHQMIYKPKPASKAKLWELQEELEKLNMEPELNYQAISVISDALEIEKLNAGRLSFSLNSESELMWADLLILDECFPADTMIDTPSGQKSLHTMISGDIINNAYGRDRVVALFKKEIKNGATQINFGEKTVTVSRKHRFFTQRGLICAEELQRGDTLCETTEAMRLLQQNYNNGKERLACSILQQNLFEALVDKATRMERKSLYQRTCEKMWSWKKEISKFWIFRSFETNRNDSKIESFFKSKSSCENKQNPQGARKQVEKSRRKWKTAHQTSISALQSIEQRLATRIFSWARWPLPRISYELQSGYRKSQIEDWNRSGWQIPLNERQAGGGQEKRSEIKGIRVESIEIFQSDDSRLDKFRDEEGKLYFYDLQAERHSSYSVEGILVHNCSMVNKQVAEDLLSFGKPILVLGDPEQLPPIYGAGYFTQHEPDILLNEIHRQALDNPIIALSKLIREGGDISLGNYGSSKVINKPLDPDEIFLHEIILTGLRKTKRACDLRCRKILNRKSQLPLLGDRLICTKNNHQIGLLNGQLWECTADAVVIDGELISLAIRDPETNEELTVTATARPFLGIAIDRYEHYPEIQEFDYAYAITVHKSQGSQWDSVLLFDQKDKFPNWSKRDRQRWLYTGITRAVERVTVMRL